jgi:carbonic anhydrase
MDDLLRNSRSGRVEYMNMYRRRLDDLARNGQAPSTLYIGCCDSRVVAEGLLGAAPGEVFVVRTVANVIPPLGSSETSVAAAIEFAVQALKVRHMVVCGHTDCGGLAAVEKGVPQGDYRGLEQWIGYIREAKADIDGVDLNSPEGHRRLVERNVLRQLEHARTYPVVRNAEASGALMLHGWFFDLDERRVHVYEADEDRFVPEHMD